MRMPTTSYSPYSILIPIKNDKIEAVAELIAVETPDSYICGAKTIVLRFSKEAAFVGP